MNITNNTTVLNFDLYVYDSTWIYWKIVLDFFYSHDSDVFIMEDE